MNLLLAQISYSRDSKKFWGSFFFYLNKYNIFKQPFKNQPHKDDPLHLAISIR